MLFLEHTEHWCTQIHDFSRGVCHTYEPSVVLQSHCFGLVEVNQQYRRVCWLNRCANNPSTALVTSGGFAKVL